MRAILKTGLTACAATALLGAAGAQADVRTNPYAGTEIEIHGTDVTITAKDHSQAHITAAGDLSIGGKPVTISAEQRGLLQQYSSGVFDMERRGRHIGGQSLTTMLGGMGTVVAALLSGEDRKQMDADLDAKVAPLKDEGRALCDVFKSEIVIQDKISSSLPAFQPYAVMEDDDAKNNCHIDDTKA
ncbi:MAG TPA: hypothetical protein VGN70_02640 [Gammaproteobacteria bacterium]|jgi:hypothetical protein